MDIFVPSYCKEFISCAKIVTIIKIKKIINAEWPIKLVNTFEVAVLRILIKRQQPIKLSVLVSGFPDDCEDDVLSAISRLRLHGYVHLDDYSHNGQLSISNERRKEVLQIVDSHIYPSNPDTQNTVEKSASTIKEKVERSMPTKARYPNSKGSRTITISLLLILGIVSALGMSLPATSPDTEFVAHHQYSVYKKWTDGNAGVLGENVDANGAISSYPYSPTTASLVALKDCNLSHSQQQT
jgi:hypothetical protein